MSLPTERYDNSDLQMKDTKATGIYDNMEEAKALKLYLQNLNLMAEAETEDKKISVRTKWIPKDKKWDYKKIPLRDLVPFQSEFERYRLKAIAQLNSLSEEELQRKLAKFEASSVFELASKIANFFIDSDRKEKEKHTLNTWFDVTPRT